MKARIIRPLPIFSIAAALTLGTVAASAQGAQPAAPMHDHGAMPMGGMGQGDHAEIMGDMRSKMHEMMAMMASHVDDRIASLKTDLKITDAQLPKWNAFADALRSAAKSIEGMHQDMTQTGAAAKPTAGTASYPDLVAVKKTGPALISTSGALPTRLENHEKMLSEHLATLNSIKAALDPLYALFSDEQKKLADGLMVGPMGVM